MNQDFKNPERSNRIIDEIIEKTEFFKIIFESLKDLIVILDRDLKILYFNSDVLKNNLNYGNKEIVGRNLRTFIYNKDIEKINNIINKTTSNSKHPITEIRLKDLNQNWIWFDLKIIEMQDKKTNILYLFILKNISEMKNAEEKYKNLFESSPNAIILLNFSGIIIDVNLTTIKLFGQKKQDFIYKPIHIFTDLYPSEIKPFFKQIFKAAFKGIFPEPIEAQLKLNNNRLIWVLIQASLVKVRQSVLIQIIYQDITEKKKIQLLEKKFKEQLELEVEERTKKLNHALKEQKLYLDQILRSSQFKTEFMSTMSHELRTPLNAIIGFTELLLEGAYGELHSEQKEVLNDIISSAEHQFDMIKNILDISKIEAGHLKLNKSTFVINNIINQVYSIFKPTIDKKNIQFLLHGLDKQYEILADPIRVKEILLNLVSNAIKFTEKGTIDIRFKEKDKK